MPQPLYRPWTPQPTYISIYVFHCARLACHLAADDPKLLGTSFCFKFSFIIPMGTFARSIIPFYFNLFTQFSYENSVLLSPLSNFGNFRFPIMLSSILLSIKILGAILFQLDFSLKLNFAPVHWIFHSSHQCAS
ncbi:hypothetical protein V6Z11_A02G142200 [Gossypium hirsutum]